MCPYKELLHKKFAYLRSIFLKKNGYPFWTLKQLIKGIEESHSNQNDGAGKFART